MDHELQRSAEQVAVGAADMLTDQLSAIKGLKQQGAQQLAADLEYFCNVLSALGVAPPTALATWQVRRQEQPCHAALLTTSPFQLCCC